MYMYTYTVLQRRDIDQVRINEHHN